MKLRCGAFQGRDQWTAQPAPVATALVDQHSEDTFDRTELRDPLAHGCQLLPGDLFHLAAVKTVLQGQQVCDLLEAEAKLLRLLDKAETLHVLRCVAPDAAKRLRRLRHQPAPLVVPDRFHMNPGLSGQRTNSAPHSHFDYVADYAPKMTGEDKISAG